MNRSMKQVAWLVPALALASAAASAQNTANVSQTGLGNLATITQAADLNLAEVIQNGEFNIAAIDQTIGSANTAVVSQSGLRNTANVLQGEGNIATIDQAGGQSGVDLVTEVVQGQRNQLQILQLDAPPFGLSRVVVSQDVENVALIDQGGLTLNSVNVSQGVGNDATVIQRGQANFVDVLQNAFNVARAQQGGLGTEADPNRILIRQGGDLDVASATQAGGRGNDIQIFQSPGIPTFADVSQVGDFNSAIVNQ